MKHTHPRPEHDLFNVILNEHEHAWISDATQLAGQILRLKNYSYEDRKETWKYLHSKMSLRPSSHSCFTQCVLR